MSANPPTVPAAVLSVALDRRIRAEEELQIMTVKLRAAKTKVLDLENAVATTEIELAELNRFLLENVPPDQEAPAASSIENMPTQ